MGASFANSMVERAFFAGVRRLASVRQYNWTVCNPSKNGARTIITFQKYVRPRSLEEAWELNQKKRNRIVGGMLWLKMCTRACGTAIDLCDLGLGEIEETENEFRIGAMVSLRQLETHAGLAAYSNGAVAEALKDIVGVQFRNGATVGGSLWRRMGFSDVLTVFMSMDSCVELYRGGIVPLEEFAGMPYDDDILVRLIVKKAPGAFAYQAVRKQSTDIPSLNCAASYIGGEYRVVVGSRPSRAMIVRDDQGILASGITEQSAAAFADYAARRIAVSGNMWGSAQYRRALVPVLVRRGLLALEEVR